MTHTLARSRTALRRLARGLRRIHSAADLRVFVAALQNKIQQRAHELPERTNRWRKRLTVQLGVRHVSGPKRVTYARDELVVVCLVRDGALYLQSFVEHYQRLGVRQIVLLDNGSTDSTLELARNYPEITILRSDLPFKTYQWQLRRYLMERFGRNRWVLCVDIDELFDYPYAGEISLRDLLGYLNAHGFTAVVAQMLDMFASEPLGARPSQVGDRLAAIYQHYDLANITREPYARRFGQYNQLGNEAIQFYTGGIRRTLFGTNDWLTKHPLVFCAEGVVPLHTGHDAYFVKVADFSAVLYHYKFLSNFRAFTEEAVNHGGYYNGSQAYRQYQQVLRQTPVLQVTQPTSRRLAHTDELIEHEFIVVSPAYQRWVQGMRTTDEVERDRPVLQRREYHRRDDGGAGGAALGPAVGGRRR